MEYDVGDIIQRVGFNFVNHFLILEHDEYWSGYTVLCLETGKTDVLWPSRSNDTVIYKKVA